MIPRTVLPALSCIIQVALQSTTLANEVPAYPVAVRYWGGPTVTIETWWHAPIAFDPTGAEEAKQSGEHFKSFFDSRGVMDEALRKRSAEKAWKAAEDISHYYDHHVSITSKPALALRLNVDGVAIVHWRDFGPAGDGETRAGAAPVDLLILPIDDPAMPTLEAAISTVSTLHPRFVLPVAAPEATPAEARRAIAAFIALAKDKFAVRAVQHNTHAIGPRAADARDKRAARPTVLELSPTPWTPEGELSKLLVEMDAACRNSQAVFRPLSVAQMNFRPSNGTHTPRWNAEHMMGRQLHFFTQIYAERDDAFTAIDLNPKQMPADYHAAYPDWTGADEARQMQRANALVHRFAYLLDGLLLDEKPAGSRWTPRGLLQQMARHFNEHTANVVKKFDLQDWPAE